MELDEVQLEELEENCMDAARAVCKNAGCGDSTATNIIISTLQSGFRQVGRDMLRDDDRLQMNFMEIIGKLAYGDR